MSDPVARLNAALDPIIKDRVTFVRTSEETDGEYSKIVVHLSPGGGNEPHFHTSFSESFSPLEGRLGVLVGKERRVLEPGETATVPAGVVHCFFNPSDQFVRFKGEARPGHRGLEQFAQTSTAATSWAGWWRTGRTRPWPAG